MPQRNIAPESRSFIILLGALAMLTSLALDMSLPALPTLAAEFSARADTVQLTISLFLIGYAGGQLFYGPFSDRFGRRPVLLFGLAVFTAAGFLSAASWSIDAMVAIRFVHGLGACSGPVLARAVLRDHFGGARAAQALSAVLAVMSVAPLLAPYVGGLVLTYAGWRWIYLLLGILGLVLFFVGWRGLGESLKHPDPQALHPWRLLANYRSFFTSRIAIGCALVNGLATGGLFAFISGSPFVLIDVYGVRSDHFGLYFGLAALGLTGGSLVNHRLVARLRLQGTMLLGLVILLAAAIAMLLVAWHGVGAAIWLMLPFVVFIFGLGLVIPNATASAMEPLPHMAGNAAALIGAMQMGFGSLAGFIVNSLYDHSAMPMVVGITLCAVAALAVFVLLVRRRPSA